MEFTVIDASVIRASCALTDRSKAPADKENYDELIAKFKDINKLDLSSFSKCILYTGYCTYNYLFHQIIKKKKIRFSQRIKKNVSYEDLTNVKHKLLLITYVLF